MKPQTYGAPRLENWVIPNQRRSRFPSDLAARVSTLWRQGFDTVAIAQRINAVPGCLVTEADVANTLARWRDRGEA